MSGAMAETTPPQVRASCLVISKRNLLANLMSMLQITAGLRTL
jgi:hypothetical protein